MLVRNSFIGYVMIILLAGTIFLTGCKSEPKTTQPDHSAQVTIPAFNRDSAYAYVQKQVNFGPRALGMEGHPQCKEWIIDKLESFGWEVERQDFDVVVYTSEEFIGTNIIASFNKNASRKIVLAAHWDTRHIAENDPNPERRDDPILGADDAGSGVAVLLELARTISENPINDLCVELVFFDAEDYGENAGREDSWCLGAQYWASSLPKSYRRPEYAILLDMVGSKGATFRREGVSLHYARHVVDKVWKLAQSMGYGHYFLNENTPPITDDHRFVNAIANIPMIDIINMNNQGRFGAYHHTHDDDMGIIDRNTLRVVGQVMLALLYRESTMAI